MVYETVKSILFYLDTRLRSGGTIGAPQFSFPNNLIGLNPQNGELIKLTMQEASIEYTFYQTENFNNKFLVSEFVFGEPEEDREIIIEIGNYNLVTFIVELTRVLNAGDLYTYILTYIPNTNQIKYTAIPKIAGTTAENIIFNFNTDFVFDLLQFNIGESMNEIMGFEVNSVIEFTNTGNNTLETQSTVPITMSPGVENLYVTVANSCGNYGNANVQNVFSSSNILAKIPVATPPFSTLYFFDLNSNFSTIITNKYLDNLNIFLFNERFTQIQPRKNWTFTMKIDIIRPHTENKTTELLKELLNITKLKFMKKNKDKENK
tara:strand:- start:4138 stop:5097 length:960 start_codon:yes stop_codon:yes gene_type:complete